MSACELITCPYRRPFARPLRAAWGTWAVREGILIRLRDGTGRTGYGEVAPLPEFGSESLRQAMDYLDTLSEGIGLEDLRQRLPEAPPATAFGLWSALHALDGCPVTRARTAALTGLEELEDGGFDRLRRAGYRTCKVKVGISDPEKELAQVRTVLQQLLPGETLRLDPNRSWDLSAFEHWTEQLAGRASSISFIEEPFRAGLLESSQLAALAKRSPVPLAIDESLSEMGWPHWLNLDWPGYWIVKPSLSGPADWMDGLSGRRDKVVLSSVFETGIGMGHLARMASGFPDNDHGLGTGAWFDDPWGLPGKAVVEALTSEKVETLWKHFCDS